MVGRVLQRFYLVEGRLNSPSPFGMFGMPAAPLFVYKSRRSGGRGASPEAFALNNLNDWTCWGASSPNRATFW